MIASFFIRGNFDANDAIQGWEKNVTLYEADLTLKTKSGGIRQVVAKYPSDTRQIMPIREHLSKISKEFAQGNFSDPARIHGNDMPGPCQASLNTIRNDCIWRVALGIKGFTRSGGRSTQTDAKGA